MLDENPRKRRKLTSSWDVLPSQLQVQPTLIFTGKDFGIGNRNGEGQNAPLLAGAEVSISASDCSRSTSSNIQSKEEGSRSGSPPWRSDDKDGHYMFEIGENLTSRYKILSKMGEGTFGQVLECWDRKSKDMVAIKIVRGLQKYREAAMIEVDVLRKVGKYDRNGTRCVQMREWFDYRNHTCIVFEKLGPSLYDFLRKNNYSPFPIDLVREVGRQLLESVAYMHELKLVHTDLKPENILFVSSDYVKAPDCKGMKGSPDDFKRLPKSSAIKLIDFGSTTFEDQDHTSVVSTRHYRAPEVILGLGWNHPCDIWSVGCILVELCSGETLFQTHENLEHLAMMERVLGPLPHHMIKKSDRRYVKYFRHGTRLNWPEGAFSRESIRAVRKLPKLRDLIMQHADHSAGLFIDLLQGLLKFEPSERLKASEAVRHPFFRQDSRRSEYIAYNS
jgi:dual-specificity kinase